MASVITKQCDSHTFHLNHNSCDRIGSKQHSRMELLGEYVFQRLSYICFILIDEKQAQFLLATAEPETAAYSHPIRLRQDTATVDYKTVSSSRAYFLLLFFLDISPLLDGRINLKRARHSAYVGKRRTLPPCDSLDE